MQGGDEHRPLDRKLERALLEQVGQHGVDPEPLPDPAEQQRPADPLGGDRQRALGVLVQRVDQQDLIGELGARGDQRSERAGGRQFVGAAEIGDHRLAHGRAVALVLDDLHVAALAGLLEAEEHGALAIEHHEIRLAAKYQAQKLCKRGTTFCENRSPPSTISMLCEREGQFTVQVGSSSVNRSPTIAEAASRGRSGVRTSSSAARNSMRLLSTAEKRAKLAMGSFAVG